eukprot:PLAT5663.1.p1 GENE.PLAT5663.1~~PLAT5663.1.p1  ORF type:complete len:423 (-),score=85.31 PLAT5663.1:116-1306(-)
MDAYALLAAKTRDAALKKLEKETLQASPPHAFSWATAGFFTRLMNAMTLPAVLRSTPMRRRVLAVCIVLIAVPLGFLLVIPTLNPSNPKCSTLYARRSTSTLLSAGGQALLVLYEFITSVLYASVTAWSMGAIVQRHAAAVWALLDASKRPSTTAYWRSMASPASRWIAAAAVIVPLSYGVSIVANVAELAKSGCASYPAAIFSTLTNVLLTFVAITSCLAVCISMRALNELAVDIRRRLTTVTSLDEARRLYRKLAYIARIMSSQLLPFLALHSIVLLVVLISVMLSAVQMPLSLFVFVAPQLLLIVSVIARMLFHMAAANDAILSLEPHVSLTCPLPLVEQSSLVLTLRATQALVGFTFVGAYVTRARLYSVAVVGLNGLFVLVKLTLAQVSQG